LDGQTTTLGKQGNANTTNLGGIMANLQKQLEEALKENNVMRIAYIRKEMLKIKMVKQGGKNNESN